MIRDERAEELWDRLIITDPDVYARLAQLPPEPPEGVSA